MPQLLSVSWTLLHTLHPNSVHALLTCGHKYLFLSNVPLTVSAFPFFFLHLLCLSVGALFIQPLVLAPDITQRISTISHRRPPKGPSFAVGRHNTERATTKGGDPWLAQQTLCQKSGDQWEEDGHAIIQKSKGKWKRRVGLCLKVCDCIKDQIWRFYFSIYLFILFFFKLLVV